MIRRGALAPRRSSSLQLNSVRIQNDVRHLPDDRPPDLADGREGEHDRLAHPHEHARDPL